MTDDQAPYDWRPLWSIFCALNSAEHPLYLAFLLPDHREKAIINAVRSNKVAVRGRRGGGYSSLVTGGVPEEIKGLNKDADVNVLQNEITVRETYVSTALKNGILARINTVSGETYVSVEADLREVEQSLCKYALPRGWREPVADEASRSRRGAPPKYDWAPIRTEAFRLLGKNGDFSLDKPKWKNQACLEKELLEFCNKTFGEEPAHSTLNEKKYLSSWIEEWRKQKRAVGN